MEIATPSQATRSQRQCPESHHFHPAVWAKWKTPCGITQRLQHGSPAQGQGPSLARHGVSRDLGFPRPGYSRRGTVRSLLPGTPGSGTLHCHLLQPVNILTPTYFSEATSTILVKGRCGRLLGPDCLFYTCEPASTITERPPRPKCPRGSGTFIHCLEHSQVVLRSGE